MRQWHSIVAIGVAATFFGCTGAAAQSTGVGSSTAGPDLFARVYEVLHHPSCSNCHPAAVDKGPRWGQGGAAHGMNVQRGREVPEGSDQAGGHGRIGMECQTCHQEENSPLPGSPPGAHAWRLAPRETMGWGGLGPKELCQDFRHRIDKVMYHLEPEIDPLVKWAWNPGPGRKPAPGTVVQFVSDMKAWTNEAKNGRPACPGD
jgi:hypothetical protein